MVLLIFSIDLLSSIHISALRVLENEVEQVHLRVSLVYAIGFELSVLVSRAFSRDLGACDQS